jgi:hypothetical protein
MNGLKFDAVHDFKTSFEASHFDKCKTELGQTTTESKTSFRKMVKKCSQS